MKASYIILCLSVDIIASVAPYADIFDLIKRQQSENKLHEILSKDKTTSFSRNEKGQTPLIAAIEAQNKKLTAAILQYTDERSVNLQDNNGNSASHCAFMHNIPIGY